MTSRAEDEEDDFKTATQLGPPSKSSDPAVDYYSDDETISQYAASSPPNQGQVAS